VFPESCSQKRAVREVSSREREQIHEKSASQTGGWYVELESLDAEERKALVGA